MTDIKSEKSTGSTSPLLVEHEAGVTTLTLNRPEINNAFDSHRPLRQT